MSNSPVASSPAGNAPLYTLLKNGEKEKLPSLDYVRFVAQHAKADGKVTRVDFALHKRGARLCRLLDAFLDSVDVDLTGKPDHVNGGMPPVVLPMATKEGCLVIFKYLDLVQTRVPTLLSKPLRAPLEEQVQQWEMLFLLEDCMGIPAAECSGFKTASFFKGISKKGPQSVDRILEVAMLSDFLVIDSLRDLSCAFLASLGLSATSEKELLQLCGLTAPLSDEDLEPLYVQFPFLRPPEDI